MHPTRFAACVLVCLPLWAGPPESATPTPSPVALDNAALDNAALDNIVESALTDAGAPSVSVALSQNGKLIYAKAFGKANVAEGRVADTKTRYAVGSISKQFTAAALLLMQEQGKLSLDDKVGKFFPDLTRANEVTVRELLSHTSGYEDYAPQDYLIPDWTHPTSAQAIMDHWAKKPLNFDPGTRWQYSNTNYVIAGAIFEKVSGQHLVEFLRKTFFDPLGMSTASDCEEKSPLDASAYTRYALGPPRPVGREAAGWYFAAGELCMVPSDLARWDMAFLAKRFLSAHSYEEFTHETKLKDGKATGYALGLDVGNLQGVPQIAHSGEVSGFLASNALYPTKNISVTVLSNEDGVNLIGPLTRSLALALLNPAEAAPAAEISQIREILEGLQQGRIDRSLFTANANTYFSDLALGDYRTSLTKLGSLQSVTRVSQSSRGGMSHPIYRAHYANGSVTLNMYVMPDQKIEQLLVEQQVQ